MDVDQAGRNLARSGVLQILEVEGRNIALRIDVDHAARLALGEELVHADAQLRTIGEVVGDGGLAADFVAQLHGTALDLEPELLDALLDHLVEDMRLGHLAQLGMPVVVVGEVDAALADFLVAQCVEHTLRDDGGAVVHAHDFTLDDRRDDHVDDLLDRDFGLVEHLGDDDHRVVAGLADAECEVAGTAAHGGQHEPVAAGAGVYVDRAGDDGAFVLGRFVAERRRALRKRQVVVDGLRHVDVGDGVFLALKELGDAVGRRSGVVAADRDEQLDVVVGEELEVEIVLEVRILGLETAHLEERTALVENAVGHAVVDVDGPGFGDEETRVTLVQADYAITVVQERLGDAAHHRVHAGGRTAPGQNSNSFFHRSIGVSCFFGSQNYAFFFKPTRKPGAIRGDAAREKRRAVSTAENRSDGNWVIYRLLNHLHVDGLLALGAVADLEFDVLTFVERLETIR